MRKQSGALPSDFRQKEPLDTHRFTDVSYQSDSEIAEMPV
jgi:hypothetical protein